MFSLNVFSNENPIDLIVELDTKDISTCINLGTVKAYKDTSQGFGYSLTKTKIKLKEKVLELGGDSFVMDNRFSSGTSTQPIKSLEADAYKCN